MKDKLSMKTKLAALAMAFTAAASLLHAQLTVPYADGSDGVLNVTSGTNIIDLSRAKTGVWTNTSSSPTNGTYDPTQWAVVFKYSNVVIASGATLVFSNHPTHAPVVWLVNGNVTINGTLNLDGANNIGSQGSLTEPGPGGFRGGGGPGFGSGPGFGPGGMNPFSHGSYNGAYGNPEITPLIGGSGSFGYGDYAGGAGGGAILIAATGTLAVNGTCHANGGVGPYIQYGENAGTYLGSGGAIRLVANQISGNGTITALAVGTFGGSLGGRIRIEANTLSGGIVTDPSTPAATPSNPATIFPPSNAPTVTVLQVAGLTAPADPKASMSTGTGPADLTLATINDVTVLLQTRNFPTNGTVTVYIKPRNSAQTTLTASYVSGNTNAALWQVDTKLIYPMHTVIQARATY